MSTLPPARRPWPGLAAAFALGVAPLLAQVPRLEEPQHSVFAAFPAADGYRVIVRDVDDKEREPIEARVPFRVHFDELGVHSLYVALRGRRPLGMIYVQNEESAFGLATVEWAITLDARVSGFRFQRVRSTHRHALEQSEFLRQLKGATREQLATLLDADGRLVKPARGVAAGGQELASAVVRSGVKSLAVLEVVWGAEIGKLRDLAVALRAFPRAARFERIWPLPPRAKTDGEGHGVVDLDQQGGEQGAEEGALIVAIRAFGPGSKLLGVVAESRVLAGDDAAEGTTVVQWVIDADGVVGDCDVSPLAPPAVRAACSEAKGTRIDVLAERADAIGHALGHLQQLLAARAKPVR